MVSKAAVAAVPERDDDEPTPVETMRFCQREENPYAHIPRRIEIRKREIAFIVILYGVRLPRRNCRAMEADAKTRMTVRCEWYE